MNAPAKLTALLLGVSVASTGSPAGAEDAISRTVIGGGNVQLAAGANAFRAGDIEEGIRLTLRGLAQDPLPRERAAALSNLCGAYAVSDRFEEALEHCDASLELRKAWRTYHNRALAYLRQGKLEAGLRDLEAGLELNPHAEALQHTLEIALALHRKPEIKIEDE